MQHKSKVYNNKNKNVIFFNKTKIEMYKIILKNTLVKLLFLFQIDQVLHNLKM